MPLRIVLNFLLRFPTWRLWFLLCFWAGFCTPQRMNLELQHHGPAWTQPQMFVLMLRRLCYVLHLEPKCPLFFYLHIFTIFLQVGSPLRSFLSPYSSSRRIGPCVVESIIWTHRTGVHIWEELYFTHLPQFLYSLHILEIAMVTINPQLLPLPFSPPYGTLTDLAPLY